MSNKLSDVPIWTLLFATFLMFIAYLFAENIKAIRENTETIKQQCIEKKERTQ